MVSTSHKRSVPSRLHLPGSKSPEMEAQVDVVDVRSAVDRGSSVFVTSGQFDFSVPRPDRSKATWPCSLIYSRAQAPFAGTRGLDCIVYRLAGHLAIAVTNTYNATASGNDAHKWHNIYFAAIYMWALVRGVHCTYEGLANVVYFRRKGLQSIDIAWRYANKFCC